MATLTTSELDELRSIINRMMIENGLTRKESRDCLNAAGQAVEDRFENARTTISNDINTASASYGISYTAQEKKIIVKSWIRQKFGREVIS